MFEIFLKCKEFYQYPAYDMHFVYHRRCELPHDKTNKITAPSKDSDQPGHPPSLIRVFAVCLVGS